MLLQERQQYIAKQIEKYGAVTTAELMNKFNVSIETVRRDLIVLENEGILKKVHGGAVRNQAPSIFRDLNVRKEEHDIRKSMLAKTAVKMINEGDVVGIDTGSTAICLAHEIKKTFEKLTVITHSLDVFEILCNTGNNVILCGGTYMPSERSFYGVHTTTVIERLFIPKLFLCPSAISIKYGICDWVEELLAVQMSMIKRSDKVYVIADSSKYETKALIKIDDVSPRYTFITDNELSDTVKQLYAENGINII